MKALNSSSQAGELIFSLSDIKSSHIRYKATVPGLHDSANNFSTTWHDEDARAH
jgi:hypothetical protein